MDLLPLIQEYFSKFHLLFLCASGVHSLYQGQMRIRWMKTRLVLSVSVKCRLNINGVSDKSLFG